MKILCKYDGSAPLFIRTGWRHVFENCGHIFKFWNTETTPAFDIFREYEPDIFIGTTYDLDRATIKNIVERPNMKVALFCSGWGDLIDSIDSSKYPLVKVKESEKRNIEELKNKSGKPDFVFLHVTDKFLEGVIGGWRKLGVSPVGILNAADVFIYHKGTFRQEYECDISIVSGYWPYKARNLDKYFGPLDIFPPEFKTKIFGWGWKHMYAHGMIDERDVKDLFVSSKICPNISEPHSTDFGFDCTERSFKVISSGGLVIHDDVEEVRDVFEGNMITFSSFDDFVSIIRTILKNYNDYWNYKLRLYNVVMNKHTYFNRVIKMFEQFNLPNEVEKVKFARQMFLRSNDINII